MSVDGQQAGLHVRPGWFSVSEAGSAVTELEPEAFFALLFGALRPEEALAGLPEEAVRLLAALFPAGAPVYWRTDVV